jgi:ABC-type multidrug transport system fused ATPase/permease subunit
VLSKLLFPSGNSQKNFEVMNTKNEGRFDFLRKLWALARPYGVAKPLIVLAVLFVQSLMQVAGVTSVFPFLSVASNPAFFRESALGKRILGPWPELTDSQLLVCAGLFSIAVLVLASLAQIAGEVVRARYAQGFGHWLQVRLLTKIVSQPWTYFLSTNTSILLKKTASDVRLMIINVVVPLLETVARAVTSLLLVATLFLVDFWVALGATIVLGAFYVVVFRLLRTLRNYVSENLKVGERGAYQDIQQVLTGIKPIKVQGAERFFVDRYSKHSHLLAKLYAKMPLFFQAPKYILEPVAFGGLIAVVVIYASLGRPFEQLLPTLGVIGFAGYRLLPSVQMLYAELSRMLANRYTVNEVYEEFQTGGVAELPTGTEEQLPLNRELRLDTIGFQYSRSRAPVIRELSLTIPINTSLAIVGPTGSGKSTLVDIILGLHEPSSGRILVDGVPLGPGNLRQWRAGVGYVPQDIFLIDDTIARNIALGLKDEAIDIEQLRKAADAAQILGFIERELPEGFHTHVGERGVRLSGGQRQRIALARALYRKPQLLILDEATSALDSETEMAVVEAIRQLQGEVTMLVVAHRLSTVKHCDYVLSLSPGSAPVLKVNNQRQP